jgi:hypothetical protein
VAVALLAVGCRQVLGLREPEARPFEHRAHVLQGIACVSCHEGIVGATDEGTLHIPDTAKCTSSGCHSEPHNPAACSGCHGLRDTRDAVAEARERLVFEHRTHVARVRGDCVQCHVSIRDPSAETLRPSMGICVGCHERQDRAELLECSACHVDLQTEGTMPAGDTHFVHESDWMRLHGARAGGSREVCESCHSESFCAGCHGRTTPARPERLRFDEPFSPGVHRGGFRARHADAARGEPGLCLTCHSEGTCASCHRENGRSATGDAATPHPAGWLGLRGEPNEHGRAARRDPALCASCHGGAGEALCINCHRVGAPGGNPHPPGWSSNLPRWSVACESCHVGGR